MKKLIAGMATAAILALAGASAHAAAGLDGAYYNIGAGIGSLANAEADVAASSGPFATFTANLVCFPACNATTGDNDSVSNFLGVPAGNSSNLSADQSGISQHVIVLTGFLNIATTGAYTVGIASDDGSQISIDNSFVLSNDFDHGFGGVSNLVNLTAGAHAVRIIQFEDGGGSGLTATLNGNALGGDLLSTGGGVPEPAAWGLMILGFGATGAALRRRRTAQVATA